MSNRFSAEQLLCGTALWKAEGWTVETRFVQLELRTVCWTSGHAEKSTVHADVTSSFDIVFA